MAEAQRVLRVGRTKIYELATEWRQTKGASGLQVVQLGSSLRVPRVALERLIGAPIHVPPEAPAAAVAAGVPVSPTADRPAFEVHSNTTPDSPNPVSTPSSRRARVDRHSPQLDLFDPPAAS